MFRVKRVGLVKELNIDLRSVQEAVPIQKVSA